MELRRVRSRCQRISRLVTTIGSASITALTGDWNAHIVQILSLPFTNGAVALERPTLVLETEPCAPGAPTKSVSSHPACVPEHEAGVVAEGDRHVTELHPSLGAPPEERHVVAREVPGADHGGRPVVLLHPLTLDQPLRAKVLCHRCARVRH